MKSIIVVICLVASISANAAISRISNGMTYCVSEYGGNLIIDWKKDTVTLVFAGSDTYKIIKEAIDKKNSGAILTARKYFDKDTYLEFKIFSTSSGDYCRVWDKDTKEYQYRPTRLSCWNEE
jgi:hypothetical protein